MKSVFEFPNTFFNNKILSLQYFFFASKWSKIILIWIILKCKLFWNLFFNFIFLLFQWKQRWAVLSKLSPVAGQSQKSIDSQSEVQSVKEYSRFFAQTFNLFWLIFFVFFIYCLISRIIFYFIILLSICTALILENKTIKSTFHFTIINICL